ncbi:MAG: DUF1565 domain-containing protein [Spirulinaceae cyanobacterium SM2_1_0]|nr:DUF1565 domain-containing protein [Spirulinaceae cyanobacterium SM2_1_0]
MLAFYIDPVRGTDSGVGSRSAPFKTLTHALAQARPGISLQLAPGTYHAASGEQFPLVVPAGVIVMGTEAGDGKTVLLLGSGTHQSPTLQAQNVTLVASDGAQLRGLTVRNSVTKGVGVWVESQLPLLSHLTISQCKLAGIFVTGDAKVLIRDCRVVDNAASGILFGRNAKGEVRRSHCDRNGYGIVCGDRAAPLCIDNQLRDNDTGFFLSRETKPVLRRNLIAGSHKHGLLAKDRAQPDLGSAQDPALNIFREGRGVELVNETLLKLVVAGNELNPARTQGEIELVTVIVDQPALGPTQFRDIDGHWAADFINALASQGLIRGFPNGNFQPEGSLTRAEYAALIAQSFDLPRQLGTRGSFSDVPESFWGATAIAKAAAMGFIAGFGDGTFRPQRNLTRVQAIASLIGGLGLTGGVPDLLLFYRDRAAIPSYAVNAVAIATQHRLVVNHPELDQLEPNRDINRAEITAFLYQALVATQRTPTLASPYIVSPDRYLPSFSDMTAHWANDFIRRLASANLVSGFADGSFQPDAPINRAQYAALLVKALNPAPLRPPARFLDVPSDFWGAAAIDQAYQAGYLSGFPDGTFHPEQQLKRVHLILSLANGLKLPAAELATLTLYRDRDAIPAYAEGAIAAATQARIVVSYPDSRQLQPRENASRADAAAMVYQTLAYQGQISHLNSAYIAGELEPVST